MSEVKVAFVVETTLGGGATVSHAAKRTAVSITIVPCHAVATIDQDNEIAPLSMRPTARVTQSQQDTVDDVGAAPCLEADVQSKPRPVELFLNQVPRRGVSRQENEPAVAQIRQRNGLVLVQKVAPRKD